MGRLSSWLVVAAGLGLGVSAAAQTGPNGPNGPSPNPEAAGTGHDAFVTDASHRTFTVTGTVVRHRGSEMVVRIDDHKHRIPFQLAAGVGQDVRVGSHVSVTYHPEGTTGQVAEQIQMLEPPHGRTKGRG